MKGYLAYDRDVKGKRPGVLVVHEWWGHNEYARKRRPHARRDGLYALAVDMYGDGKQAMHPDDAGKLLLRVDEELRYGKSTFHCGRGIS